MRHRVEAVVIAVIGVGVFWLLANLSKSPVQRVAVSGTLIGAEDRDGLIMFISQEKDATVAITELRRGKYEFTSETGPVPGTQKILIRFEASNALIPAESFDPIFKNVDEGSKIPAYEPAISLMTRIPDDGSDRLDLELP